MEFGNWKLFFGRVAQLAEHLVDVEGVRGSSPLPPKMEKFTLKNILNIISSSFPSLDLGKISTFLISFSIKILFAILIIYFLKYILFLFLSGSLKTLRKVPFETQRLESLLKVTKDFITYFSYFLIFVIILVNLGIDLKSLLISFGILGLIISLSLQSLLTDVLEGFYIVLENRFKIGDRVKVNAIEGVVQDFNLRRTIIVDDEGNIHRIPNSQLKILTLIKKS